MKRISFAIVLLSLIFAPFHLNAANLIPSEKNASKSKKQPRLSGPPVIIPREYIVLERARKDSMAPKLTLSQILLNQMDLKNLGWVTGNHSIEKESEDLYWFFEIARGEKLGGTAALDEWIKALNSLHQYKWIYAWTENTSAALAKICKIPANKKKSKGDLSKSEKCVYIAKKVSDAFPKLAVETQALKEIIGDVTTGDLSDNKYERISQTYSEKVEKDEVEFAGVLDQYLNRRDPELYRTAEAFLSVYPKSMLRFRVMFLVAERQFAHGDKKIAEKNYRDLMDQIPYSYYAIVASERLGVSLRDRLTKDPIHVADLSLFNLNFAEKVALARLQNLILGKQENAVSMELEQFSRLRAYPTDFIVYLIQQANIANQDLSGFRLATEIIQRKGEIPKNIEFAELIFPNRYTKEIEDQAKISKIDPLLVTALMKQESGFRGGILSSSGAAGLMQLMPFTALEVQKDVQLRKLREPVKNIEVGTMYLASLLNDKFNGNVVYALAGYNAGPHRVAKWRKDAKPDWGMQEFVEAIPFKETRDYVMSILRNRYWYQYRQGLPAQSVFEAWRSP